MRQEKVVWRQSRISLSCFNLGQLDSRDSFNCTSYFIPFNLYPHDGHHHGQQPKDVDAENDDFATVMYKHQPVPQMAKV